MIHVIPVFADEPVHDESETCFCSPYTSTDDHDVIIHRRVVCFDGVVVELPDPGIS